MTKTKMKMGTSASLHRNRACRSSSALRNRSLRKPKRSLQPPSSRPWTCRRTSSANERKPGSGWKRCARSARWTRSVERRKKGPRRSARPSRKKCSSRCKASRASHRKRGKIGCFDLHSFVQFITFQLADLYRLYSHETLTFICIAFWV